MKQKKALKSPKINKIGEYKANFKKKAINKQVLRGHLTPKIVIVTGTPGTGKTFISRIIAKSLGLRHIELSKFIKQRGLYESIDKTRKSYVVDEKKLVEALKREFRRQLLKQTPSKKVKGFVVDGHMSHFLPPTLVNIAICTKAPLKTIKQRLEQRNYSKTKIRENLDCEIFDICYTETLEAGHKPIIFDGSNPKTLLNSIK